MIGQCQDGKSSLPTRLEGARNKTLQGLQLAFVPLGGGSLGLRTSHPFAVSAHRLPQEIEFVISCQPRNMSKWASELVLCCPVPARPGKTRAEESLLILRRP